jgi:hypothetical protein
MIYRRLSDENRINRNVSARRKSVVLTVDAVK